jgi:hypothetical protein
MKIWYLKFPTYKHYDIDVKAEAIKAKAKIIDERFQGEEKSAEDCPKVKGQEEPKKRGRKPKVVEPETQEDA